jgi:hypothetical protein
MDYIVGEDKTYLHRKHSGEKINAGMSVGEQERVFALILPKQETPETFASLNLRLVLLSHLSSSPRLSSWVQAPLTPASRPLDV